MSKFHTVVADPPWPYKNPGEFTSGMTPIARGAGSDVRYGKLTMAELLDLPVLDHVADDAHLYLWTTNAFLRYAFTVAETWGFRPITVCTWVKTTEEPVLCQECRRVAHEIGVDPSEVATSLPVGTVRASPRSGYYFRGATEHCLFAVRGSQKLLTEEVLPTAWLWPRLPHSVKPDAFYDLVERASPGPYLELFARRNRLGWDTWGNEALEHVVVGPDTNVVARSNEPQTS